MIVLSLLNLVVMLGFCYLYTHPTLIVNIDWDQTANIVILIHHIDCYQMAHI
jgi:hypothetical protein